MRGLANMTCLPSDLLTDMYCQAEQLICTRKYKLIIFLLTKNKMHTNSSVSLVLALLKVLANTYSKTMVYVPSVSMRESIGSTTSFFHISMVVHTGSDDHLHICKFIHKGLLSLSLKNNSM